MRNLKLSQKLVGGFLIVVFIVLIIGFTGWRGVSQTDNALEEVNKIHLPGILALGIIKEAQTAVQKSVHGLLIQEFIIDISEMGYQIKGLEEAWKRAEEGMKIYDPLPKTKEEAETWKDFKLTWERLTENTKQVTGFAKSGNRDPAINFVTGKGREVFMASDKFIADLISLNRKSAEEVKKRSEAQADRARVISLVGMIIGTLVALGLGIFLSRSITKPIGRVIKGLTEGAEQVVSASSQVSSASQSLAEGASEQAAGIEETSSSIEEMSSMTRQNADNANQANNLMADTSRVVEEANRSMAELTGSMKEISTASEETAKIIKTIDEIAFQTNLLALNAAVEAARAGEAGAGFAVVADEVRNLAMRAADAAKNTANLIEGTVKKIKNGSEIVSKTNEAFGKVATGAKKVGELVGEIAAASQEQSQGIEQINKAVSEMDKVVQKNAASAEESASASEEMNAQAGQMKAFVQELVAVVGGSRDGNGVFTNAEFGRYDRPYRGGLRNVGSKFVGAIHESPLRSSEPKKPVGNGKRQVSQFINKVTDGAKKKEMKYPVPKAREVKPDQVIPMEEADDFKEF